MATLLKKGDKVRAKWDFGEFLTAGKIYTVAVDQDDERWIKLEYDDREATFNVNFYSHRFEKVEEESPKSKLMRCVSTDGTFEYGALYKVREYGEAQYVAVWEDYLQDFQEGWDRSRFVDVTSETEKPVSAKDTQIGGTHYTKLAIQPFEYANANNMGPCEFTALGYITRWKDKGGVEDLKKAVHAIQWLIEWTEKNGPHSS